MSEKMAYTGKDMMEKFWKYLNNFPHTFFFYHWDTRSDSSESVISEM